MEGPVSTQQPRLRSRSSVVSLLFLIVSLVLTYAMASVLVSQIYRRAGLEFVQEVDRLNALVGPSLESYRDIMLGASGLLSREQQQITRQDWREYVELLQSAERLKGLRVLEFIERVSVDERAAFVEKIQSDTSRDSGGYPNFQILPLGQRSEYYVVNYLEPMEPNSVAFGFDALSEPTRRAAIERARDEGVVTTTGRVMLLQGQPGLIFFLPVYDTFQVPATLEARRQHIRGVVAAVLDPVQLFTQAFGLTGQDNGTPSIDIEVHDGTRTNLGSAESLLYHQSVSLGSDFQMRTTTVEFAGHPFLIIARAGRSFGVGAEHTLPLVVVVAGTLLSITGFWIVYNADRARQQLRVVEHQMREDLASRTRDLAERNQTLETEVVNRTTALAKKVEESEQSKTAILNVLDDLTLTKEQLESARAYDEALVASIADGLIAIDLNGHISAVNNAAVRLLGHKQEELLGHPLTDVITVLDKDGKMVNVADRPLLRALHGVAGQTFSDSAHYYVRAGGVPFPVIIDSAPIILGGEVHGAIEVFRDITHEKEIDRAKSELVSLASHQLRTPLTAISWYSELLLTQEDAPLAPDQRHYLAEINNANRRMIDLVDALLNVSRIEMGTLNVKAEPTAVVPLIRRIVTQFNIQIQEREMKVDQRYDDTVSTILVDPRLLSIVVENLVSNALKYTPRGGSITITVKQEVHNLVFVIADTGIGIPANQQAKVFDKLFRADNARLSDTDGTGLGLYLAHSIIERLGGSITFISKEGSGTTFTVRMPIGSLEKEPEGPVNSTRPA